MKATSYFTLRKSKEKCAIYVLLYIRSERVMFSTNINVDDKNFDVLSGRVLSKDKDNKDKNIVLDNIHARISDVFVKYRLRDKKLTKDIFMKAYSKPDDYNDFFGYVDTYIKRTRITLEDSTIVVHRSVFKRLKAYKEDLMFEDIDVNFVECYFHYMRKKQKFSESYAYKNLSILKKYVRAAVREGYMDIDPFVTFKVRKIKSTNFVFLEEKELKMLIEYYHGKTIPALHVPVLRFFLWMCFGSQHVTDAKNTMIEDIHNHYLHYYRVKLRNSKPELLKIPMSEPLEMIFKESAGTRKKGALFIDIPSDQKINKHLKEIAQTAGVDKAITCKTGRHTFATYFLSKTHQLTTLQNLLGHSNMSETLIYAHVLDESKEQGVKCFNTFTA